MSRMSQGRPSSPVTRLDVTKTLGEGLTLKRSHSCGEMRRRMVLTEWEVVTTTNTEVTVTETGPAASQHPNGVTPSSDETERNEAQNDGVGSEIQVADLSRSTHDSRSKTLGLAKSIKEHRRSKSSDGRTQRHVNMDDDSLPANNQDEEKYATDNMEPQQEYSLGLRSYSNISTLFTERSQESDIASGVKQLSDAADFPFFSMDDKLRTHQSSRENTTPVNGASAQSDSGVVSTEDCCPTVNQILDGTGPGSKAIQMIATYKLSEPSAVDVFRSIEDTEREDRWATGLNADLVLDYTLVDIVEKIRLRTDGDELNVEEPYFTEQTVRHSEQNSVTGRSSEVEFSNDTEQIVTESNNTPETIQCQPATDHRRNGCNSNTAASNDSIDEIAVFVDSRREMQDVLTLADEACTVERACNDAALTGERTRCEADTSRVKEDEDSEEKEADEAENREMESDETEEKGILELNYSRIVEKNNEITADDVSEIQSELVDVDHERSLRETVEEESVRDDGSVVNGGRDADPDAASSTCEGDCGLTQQPDSYPKVPESVHTHHNETDAVSSGGASPSSFSQSHSADTESSCVESRKTSSYIADHQPSGVLAISDITGGLQVKAESNHGCVAYKSHERCAGEVTAGPEQLIPTLNNFELANNGKENNLAPGVNKLDEDDIVPELGPSMMPIDHIQCAEYPEHSTETSAEDIDETRNKTAFASTGTDTDYDDNCPSAVDDTIITFDHEDSNVGHTVHSGTMDPTRRRKNVVDVESQTEESRSEDVKPATAEASSESTQFTVDPSHPFNSCTAVNCLVCATIGKFYVTYTSENLYRLYQPVRSQEFLCSRSTSPMELPTDRDPEDRYYLRTLGL